MKVLLMSLIGIMPLFAYTQQTTTFIVRDTAGTSIANATIKLLNETGKVLISGATDTSGHLSLNTAGAYSVVISCIGFIPFQKKLDPIINTATQVITLRNNIAALNEIKVTAKKPTIVMTPDRYILNIDGQTAMGTNGLSIIKKAPGINIANNEITLEGKPVIVQINEKTISLSGNELVQFLSSQAALNISQVELINTPPSGMDANISGGVINIKTRKLKHPGFNGYISAEAAMRSRYAGENGSAGINFRKGKLTVSSSFNGSKDIRNSSAETTRHLALNSGPLTTAELNNSQFTQHNFSQLTSADWQISRKSVVSLQMNSNYYKNNNNIQSTSNISSNQLDSIYLFKAIAGQRNINNSINLNFRSNLDSAGSSINIDLDYSNRNSKSNGDQDFTSLFPNGTFKSSYVIDQFTGIESGIYGVKIDYKKKLAKVLIETGFKMTNISVNYQLEEARTASSDVVLRADAFTYTEKVTAAYLNAGGKFSTVSYNAGIRAELTDIDNNSSATGKKNSSAYFNIFPTLSLSKQLDKKNSLSFSYRKSISRPGFRQLNPFKYYTGPFYYFSGNPDLRPFYPHSIRFGYNYDNKIMLTVSSSFASNKITETSIQAAQSNVIQNTRLNNGKYFTIYSGITHNGKFASWWTTNSTVSLGYNNSSFIIDAKETAVNNTSVSFYTTQQFSFGGSWQGELYAYFASPAYYDANRSQAFWYTDIRITKALKKINSELSFSATDVFYTNVTRTVTKYNNINSSLVSRWDSRQVSIGFLHRFGNKELRTNRQRSNTATTEEQRRVG